MIDGECSLEACWPEPEFEPEPGSEFDEIIVYALDELLRESEAILVARIVFGEARGGPPERWRWVGASILVRAASNYGNRGTLIHSQVLSPGSYNVLDHLTRSVEPNENMKKTTEPTRETGGKKKFIEIYHEVAPMVEAALGGNYSQLPLEFQGQDAYDSFRVANPGDAQKISGEVRWGHYWSQGRIARAWPWKPIRRRSDQIYRVLGEELIR